MNSAIKFIRSLILIPLFLLACQRSVTDPNQLYKIISTNVDKQFVRADGSVFEPWGYNYTNPQIIGLIEDNWDNEWAWTIIEEDFQEMADYEANTIRVHLQYNKFMTDPQTTNPEAFTKLKRLVDIAKKEGLYLLITGLGAYRKSDSPEWYDALSDDERWDTQARFWASVAAEIGESPAVFSYDLINEPLVSVGQNWLYNQPFGGYHFVQNIALNSQTGFEDTMGRWIDTMTSAIRRVDDKTLITVGFFPSQNISNLAPHLDFISPHLSEKA